MAGAGEHAAPGLQLAPHVAILTDLEWPVLVKKHVTGNGRASKLRSSPTWNGRCWQNRFRTGWRGVLVAILTDLEWPVLAVISALFFPVVASCDPHRLGMAGAGVAYSAIVEAITGVAILTDLEWPVLVELVTG